MSAQTDAIFGSLITAMVTPFSDSGAIDEAATRALATHLVDRMRNDTVLVNGTTGEAPTTSDAEKSRLIALVKDEVGDRAKVLAGVGSNDTSHTIELAKEAAEAGADGLLVVTPYYNRPPQDALVDHFTAVADATELPVILYDIPKRTGTEIAPQTLTTLARHQRIVGIKDAKGKVVESARVMAETGLHYWSGDDAITLPLLAVGAVGVIGTSTHFIGDRVKAMMADFQAGNLDAALSEYRQLLPVMEGVFATQGCMLVKAGLAYLGLPVGGLRPPLKPASADESAAFASLLDAAGVERIA